MNPKHPEGYNYTDEEEDEFDWNVKPRRIYDYRINDLLDD